MIARTLALLLALAGTAAAQPRAPGTDYPNRPVRIVVALAPAAMPT
jgi:tripartite-type tricarboxylate transporter receptor subunit TctC